MNRHLRIDVIQETLARLGMNNSDLAEKVNVSRTIVSQWLSSAKIPRPRNLLKIGMALGLNSQDLIAEAAQNVPEVAFRKKGARKTTAEHIQQARDMGQMLTTLAPYLPGERLVHPPVLRNPQVGYDYIQSAALEIRRRLKVSQVEPIKFEVLINALIDLDVVLIPVFWGDRENHANALHVFTPCNKITWIYVNLDSRIHDFKFWLAHEIGHILSPSLSGIAGEDFSELFAQALLFPEDCARAVHAELTASPDRDHFNTIIRYAEKHVISPITVLKAVNEFAEHHGGRTFPEDKAFYAATTNFNKNFPTVSSGLFGKGVPSAGEYIRISGKIFGKTFFQALSKFLSENEKGAGYIQSVLDIPLVDAKAIYAELAG